MSLKLGSNLRGSFYWALGNLDVNVAVVEEQDGTFSVRGLSQGKNYHDGPLIAGPFETLDEAKVAYLLNI